MICYDLRRFLRVILYVVALLITIAHAIVALIHGINIKNSRTLNVDKSWKLILVIVCLAIFSFFEFLNGVADKHLDLLWVVAIHVLAWAIALRIGPRRTWHMINFGRLIPAGTNCDWSCSVMPRMWCLKFRVARRFHLVFAARCSFVFERTRLILSWR